MISIIGAGPVGSYAAYLLAKKGHKVNVYEEHSAIGKPVQCTGIVTSSVNDILKVKNDLIINKVKLARIHSPNGQSIEVKLAKPNLILDREQFDKHLAEMAEEAGAKINLKHKFEGIKNGKIIVNKKEMPTDFLIGADGPNSAVSRYIWNEKRKYVIGIQSRVRKEIDPEVVEFWLGLGEFAWLVPESNKTARVGMVGAKNLSPQFNELLKKVRGKTMSTLGGLIPVYDPKQRIQRKSIMTIGDAAGQVKATTYGGIIPGLMAAEEIGKSLKNYETNYNKRMKKELYLGLMMRKAMNRFTPQEYDNLVGYFTQDKIKRILEEEDRDFPSRFLFKILLREPRLMKFSKKLMP